MIPNYKAIYIKKLTETEFRKYAKDIIESNTFNKKQMRAQLINDKIPDVNGDIKILLNYMNKLMIPDNLHIIKFKMIFYISVMKELT